MVEDSEGGVSAGLLLATLKRQQCQQQRGDHVSPGYAGNTIRADQTTGRAMAKHRMKCVRCRFLQVAMSVGLRVDASNGIQLLWVGEGDFSPLELLDARTCLSAS